MTSRHQTHDIGTVPFAQSDDTEIGGPAPWSTRLCARLFAGRYDRQIEDGVRPVQGSPLALHCARLISARERDDLAYALRLVVHDADHAAGRSHSRVPVRSVAVHHCAEVIGAVYDRLADPFPVRARGMARLRILLSDGCGPLYRSGEGTLTAALRGVLATL
jgi:hypothetical protein